MSHPITVEISNKTDSEISEILDYFDLVTPTNWMLLSLNNDTPESIDEWLSRRNVFIPKDQIQTLILNPLLKSTTHKDMQIIWLCPEPKTICVYGYC